MNYRDFYRKEQALSGGKGDDLSSSQVDPVELSKGVKVEMEHTKDPKIAQEIALDHLAEDPKYYSRLQAADMTDELPKGRLGGMEPLQPNAALDTTRLKGVAIAKIINPAVALGGASPQTCPESPGGSTTPAPGDKEPITAAGKVLNAFFRVFSSVLCLYFIP